MVRAVFDHRPPDIINRMQQRLPLVSTLGLLLLCLGSLAPVFLVFAQSSLPRDDLTPIFAIQGRDASSPLAGRRVDTVGVVTGVTSTGFFLQDPSGDGDTATSDGIFVYTRSRPRLAANQCVLVEGATVNEFYAKTELMNASAVTPSDLCPTTTLSPAPVAAARFDQNPAALYEAYEGMLVQMGSDFAAVVYGPAKRFAGGEVEIAVVAERLHPYVGGGRIFPQQNVYATALLYLSNRLGVQLPAANWGDRLASDGEDGLRAVLDYAFGKYQFLLLPDQTLAHTAQPLSIAPAAPATSSDFTVCTYNLWGLGRGREQYADDALYGAELHRRARSIAEHLQGCTVLALQETGAAADAENLASYLSTHFGLPYQATALPGPGSADLNFPLTNSVLTRSDRVEVVEAELGQGCTAVDYGVLAAGAGCPANQYPLFERPPLLVRMQVAGAWRGNPLSLTLIDNHWKSKAGDESQNLPWRIAQARHVALLAQAQLDAGAHLIVLGDLNDYDETEPLAILRTGVTPSLVHASAYVSRADRFTYIFDGVSQAVDHIWISPSLTPSLAEIRPIHVNAAYASPEAGSDAPLHVSDHDPIWMRLRPDGVAAIGGAVAYAGVRIELVGAAGKPVAATVSDALGDYRLWNIAPGAYTLRHSAPEGVTILDAEIDLSIEAGFNRAPAPEIVHRAGMLGAVMASMAPALRVQYFARTQP
jgi:hypothetical protein